LQDAVRVLLNAYSHFLVARFTSNGNTGWAALVPMGKLLPIFSLNDFCNGIAIQPDDKIVAAGFTT